MKLYLRKITLFVFILVIASITRAEINRDLELDKLFNAINYTQTLHGNKSLQCLLAHPIEDRHALNSRQAIISHLVDNEPLYAKLNLLLKQYASYEPYFERMQQEETDIEAVALEDFYFSHPYFKQWNYSPGCLECGQIAYFGNLCSSLVQHSLAFAIFTWGLEEEHVCDVHPPKKHDHDKHEHKEKHHHKHNDGSTCNHTHDQADNLFTQGLKALARSKECRRVFQLWHGIAQVQELYSIQAIVRNHLKCMKELQTQLIGIADGMRTMHALCAELNSHAEITDNLIGYKDLTNISGSIKVSQKLKTLLDLLKTDTFKGEASVFSRVGIILAAYKLAQDIGHELQPALDAIGEIDAYMSCAHLFKKHENAPLCYSFAHYGANTAHPHLRAHNFWHPLAVVDTMQLNTISLGTDTMTQNIIVTGPNACGKSTSLKALTLCAYLAQTITIVPAQEYSQTIYKEIYSSMVVADNLGENKSTFVSELTDAELLLEKVENLKEGEYMLITLDELFKSTHHEKGEKLACQFLEQLYESSRVITLISTHFERLVTLADKQKWCCANYTIDNFVLQPGVGFPDNSFDIVCKQVRSRLIL